MKFKFSDIFIAVAILVIILLIIMPLAPFLLDVLLIVNISASILIMLVTLYSKSAMQFSTFPSVLLIVTLFRLSLNISSTRLILGNGGDAGHVIETFGSFVIGDNLVVGLVLFPYYHYHPVHRHHQGFRTRGRGWGARSPSTPCPASRWRSTPTSTPESSTRCRPNNGAWISRTKPTFTGRWTARANS